MFTLMLPCAGRSSRYPNRRPKWSLTHPSGRLMIEQGIMGLDLSNFNAVCMAALKEDIEKYKLRDAIYKTFEKLELEFTLVELKTPTNSQSETVASMIKNANIEGNIFIKDCDGYFEAEDIFPNSVCVYSLHQLEEIIAKNKSYVEIDKNECIKTIVEKKVISELFCCGGYSFKDAKLFLDTFGEVKKIASEEEIYISHIIFQLLIKGHNFKILKTNNFIDWGTLRDWDNYKDQYKTIFTDLDGVLVENSSEHFPPYWGTTNAISKNVDTLNKLYDSGKVRIIITTSRKSLYKDVTLTQLKKLGIKYHNIIFDLLHCERIIINDYSLTNSFPTCKAINIERDSHNLDTFL